MSYIIGSFNLRKLADAEKKNLDVIANIIKDENMDIVALQEVFREDAVAKLLTPLGKNNWDYSWNKPMNNDSSNANEGYAYLWNKNKLGKVVSYSEKSGKREFEPRINYQYRKFGGSELLRPPYYGRFTPSECSGGNQMELRLLNIHLRFTGDELSSILARKHEFMIITEGLLPMIQDKVYQTQYNTYTIILGDYNLNIRNGNNESCKMQYKFVGFVENNFVGKPTFLFSTFGV